MEISEISRGVFMVLKFCFEDLELSEVRSLHKLGVLVILVSPQTSSLAWSPSVLSATLLASTFMNGSSEHLLRQAKNLSKQRCGTRSTHRMRMCRRSLDQIPLCLSRMYTSCQGKPRDILMICLFGLVLRDPRTPQSPCFLIS